MRRLFLVALFTTLGLLAATPTFAEEHSVTAQINVSMYGQNLVGAAVGKYSLTPQQEADALAGKSVQGVNVSGTFVGQLNGQPANVSGTWSGQWDGKNYLGNVTSINGWPSVDNRSFSLGGVTLPAGSIKVPAPVGQRLDVRSGSVFVVTQTPTFGETSLQLNVQAPGFDSAKNALPNPASKINNFQVTNQAGVQEIRGLPRTGEVPAIYNLMAMISIVVGAGALVASRRTVGSAA